MTCWFVCILSSWNRIGHACTRYESGGFEPTVGAGPVTIESDWNAYNIPTPPIFLHGRGWSGFRNGGDQWAGRDGAPPPTASTAGCGGAGAELDARYVDAGEGAESILVRFKETVARY